MEGYVYGVKHDYIPFERRYEDFEDTIIIDDLQDILKEAKNLSAQLGYEVNVIDDNGVLIETDSSTSSI